VNNFNLTAKKITKNALYAVDPYNLVLNNLKIQENILFIKDKKIDLDKFDKIHIIGCGKGATYLYKGLKKIVGHRISSGIIVSIKEHSFKDKKVKFFEGSHPIPDRKSLDSGTAVYNYVKNEIKSKDLVFFLITGGASSILIKPFQGINFEDKIKINELLLLCGADIREINCVRKHISAIKGGRLAELIFPAKLVTLIVSDIVDSPFEHIGSGPTIGDSTTFSDAYEVLKKYNLIQKLSPGIIDYFLKGINKEIPDTPSPDSEIFSKNYSFLIGDNLIALESAKKEAEDLGIKTFILTSRDNGEPLQVAKVYSSMVKKIILSKSSFKSPVLLLCGGELSVYVKGKGKGGRNQEFVLNMLKELKPIKKPFYISSIGTDGIDGPTDAAGAWIDEKTINKVNRLKLNIDSYLKDNDSYHFFQKINQLIKTGPTRTNVMDLRMFYIP
jgi:glycerate-2-kinase